MTIPSLVSTSSSSDDLLSSSSALRPPSQVGTVASPLSESPMPPPMMPPPPPFFQGSSQRSSHACSHTYSLDAHAVSFEPLSQNDDINDDRNYNYTDLEVGVVDGSVVDGSAVDGSSAVDDSVSSLNDRLMGISHASTTTHEERAEGGDPRLCIKVNIMDMTG